jgi:O-antigen/teichoic acid export membrane protein
MTIVASVFPAIIEAKKANESLYLGRLRNLYELMVVLALSLAIPMTFMAEWLVIFLFGEAYAPAGLILAVHIWAGVFVFLGVASGKWFLVENLQKFVFYRTVAGAIVNVGLNYFMIPTYGAVGAAIATVISQATASVLFNVVNERTRPVFYMLCKSFLLRGLLKYRWADVHK